MSKRTKKYFINVILIVAMTILVVYLSLKDNFSSVISLLSNAAPMWILVCLSMILVYHTIVAYILRLFARMYNSSFTFRDGMRNAFIAALFHGITPFASGGQFVQAYVFYKQDIKVSDSASILLMDFILYQSTLVIYTFVLLIMRFQDFSAAGSTIFTLAFLGFGVNCFVIVGLWLLAKSKGLHHFLTHQGIQFAAKLKLVKDPEGKAAQINDQVNRFRTELARLSTHRSLMIKVIAANVVRLTIYYSIPYVACIALGWSGKLSLVLDIIALSAFVNMVNSFIPLPGASGGTEGTYMLMFSLILPNSLAVGSMLIWRFCTYHFIMLLGLLEFVLFRRRSSIKNIEEDIYENENRSV